jgi:xanthine/uracil/vitamin C permease (AzgA family)
MASHEASKKTNAVSPKSCARGFKSMLTKQFGLTDFTSQTIWREILGGLVMYLVSLQALRVSVNSQAGSCPTCLVDSNATSSAGYTAIEYRALPGAISLAAGISTLVMGLLGNMPIVVAPGITGVALQAVSIAIGPDGAKAGALIVGLSILAFSLASKRIKYISSIPEDYRLGVAAGKGGVIALTALRNSGLVSASTVGFIFTFNYNVILSICGFVIIILLQDRQYIIFSFVGEMVIITAASLIISAATGTTIVGPKQAVLADMSIVAGLPSFVGFVEANGFLIFKYVIGATLNTLIDIVATVTALIFMTVVRINIGYDKKTFTSALSESTKCYKIFLSIALCEVFVSPFLGVAPVSHFL